MLRYSLSVKKKKKTSMLCTFRVICPEISNYFKVCVGMGCDKCWGDGPSLFLSPKHKCIDSNAVF